MSSRNAGFYVPGAVQVILGAPIGLGGLAVVIPNLPAGVGFPFLMSGRASDEFASADQTEDTVSLEVGADGEGVYVLSFNRSGTLVITVMKTSFLNVGLSFAHNAMRNQANPLIFTIPVTYKDPFAIGSKMSAKACVLQRSPPMTFGASVGTNAWTLLTHDLEINHGANAFQ